VQPPRIHVHDFKRLESADLSRLRGFFSEADLVWRAVQQAPDRKRALVVAHVREHAIMERLDAVCGPENWRNKFGRGPNGGAVCGLSIRVNGEWIVKWDTLEIMPYMKTGSRPIQQVVDADQKPGIRRWGGGLRRAALLWGIGRYLSRIPNQWIPIDDNGGLTCRPNIPPDFRTETRRDPFDSTLLRVGHPISRTGTQVS
jgi:hypothetical protein